MRDLEEKEVIEVSGGACEPVVECKIVCSVSRPPVCTAQCSVTIKCSL